jgi:hypothetical protein
MFEFMNSAYKWIGGFQSFTGEDDFSDRSYLWMITYQGSAPEDTSKIDMNRVYTVSVFKKKYGLKLVGIGNNRFENLPADQRKVMKAKAKDAMRKHIEFVAKNGWAEVSGAMEKLFAYNLSPEWIIEPEDLKEVPDFADIEILPDNLHYSRRLRNGTEVTKIAYGTMRI